MKQNIFAIIALVFIAVALCFINLQNIEQKPVAREVLEYTEFLVREKKPAPTESALAYAYVTTAYYETFIVTNSTTTATQVALYVADRFFASTSTFFLSNVEESFTEKYLLRMKNDRRSEATYVNPKGSHVWVDRDENLKTPFTPNAGKWKRWNVEGVTFEVPRPPTFLSKAHTDAVEEVKLASEMRTGEQGAAINFWGGIPGTNQPAGIWLDFFYETTKEERMNEKEFAYKQMIIAQTLSDAFMECWKVKYTYWTKRPDMVNKTINTAMPNPPFPSYVSGHSTISFAAATVLAKMFPENKDLYLENAEEAKNSRLWAGIHYSYDNEEGKKLGIKVGEATIKEKLLK
jgi:PAP2 superfamily